MTLSNSKKSANLLLAIFIILTLLLSIGGYVLYRNQTKNITIQKHEVLAAISQLKIDLIVSWRKDYREKALSIYNNQSLINDINEYIHGVDHNANYLKITSWVKTILYEPDYSMVSLIDPSGKIIINTNPAEPITDFDKRIIGQAKLNQDIIFSDLLTYYDINAFIDLAIPLYLNPKKHEGFSGVLLLRIDPEKFFYPLILNWPTPSLSSEVLLARREGDSILFISELNHKRNTAIHFFKPLTDSLLIPSQVLAGKTGRLEGVDYRGIKILEDMNPVPGSPWFVIAKVDMNEIYHPIIALAFWIFIITFLLILISGFIIYGVWTRLLNKSQHEHNALLEHLDYVIKYANDIIFLSDTEGTIYEANDKAVATYGYTHDELLKLNIMQFRPIEIRNTIDQQVKLLNEMNGKIYETVHIRKNGKKFPVEISSRIIEIMGEQFNHAIIRDITERKLAEEKLRASEEGFRTLADLIPQIVWTAQADGMIDYISLQWVEYTGLTLEESYGTDWDKPFHPDEKQHVWEVWKQDLASGENHDLESRIRKYDGVYHWFVIRAVPMHNSSGVITKWYGTCTNIDSQKQAEKEIKTLNEELELKVTERTLQLQTANKELEAFSYSVSHDLRAPLQNIDGWSIKLFENYYDKIDEQGRKYLDQVRNETIRMGLLIEALLKLSRVSRTELTKVNVDLTILAHNITKNLLNETTNRQIEIIIQPGMVAFGDPDMLEIVLTNLLNNAFKFTGKQPVAHIEFGQSLIDKKQTFWVRDNGAGFDMDNSKKLFGAFQRMHKQTDFPGTGIGLATVQRIIHRHNGHIWAESKINQGTTFYFTIPEEI